MKVGYELELLAPPGHTRYSVAAAFAEKFRLTMKACFHRESETWPGSNDKSPFYCLTKGFELANQSDWQFRLINDMTISNGIDAQVTPSPGWYHVLAQDIRTIELIRRLCDSAAPVDQILKPVADFFETTVKLNQGVYSVSSPRGELVCGAHSLMTDRNRICEVVTAPITEHHGERLGEIVELAASLGCTVPLEGAFHIHFDGAAFAKPSTLLRFIRYCYVWSDVLKAMIPPNPHCTRLGDYSAAVVDYAFDMENSQKSFEQVVSELKNLAPVKYCDFNFNNILIGDPQKLTVEVRVIPMVLDSAALSAASDLYMGFVSFILGTDLEFEREKVAATEENVARLVEIL